LKPLLHFRTLLKPLLHFKDPVETPLPGAVATQLAERLPPAAVRCGAPVASISHRTVTLLDGSTVTASKGVSTRGR
jgi:hypothetical protein